MGLFGMAASYLAFSVLHFFQLVLAVTVCGLYAVDLNRARSEGSYTDGKWVFAVVVGALSAVTALLYFIPFILRFAIVWIWDVILFILWIALFGLFGNMYIKENAEGDSGIQRMKNAVWVDLANALLWLISALATAGYWWRHRERRTRFTGRGKV
ncbi:hypothetical protein CORC01_01414 [Colletotrichum orchidophilum]|uniref:MARVEL domain-containing protein n=1 Tax=Colletotrichum orchidophilum TaxID=1209926 RepID=A0A1G4BPH0_9PEZI|nr:uncharacterized protein CORC01_01414 [Colletotrichum orchidophilum]OHF03361.1 hypothetical protein CORC01_01414 [Colletotrichum orchidophilum]